MPTKQKLPKYNCHKQVEAVKIVELHRNATNDNSLILTPENNEYGSFIVSDEYVKKHNPQVGGYYVVYEDSYESYSPSDVFERGYTKQ